MTDDAFDRLHASPSARRTHNTEVLRQKGVLASKSVKPDPETGCPDGFSLNPDNENECIEDSPNDSRPRGPDSPRDRVNKGLHDLLLEMKSQRHLLERIEGLRTAQELEVLRKSLQRDPKGTLKLVEARVRKRPGLSEQLDAAMRRRRR